MSEQAIEQGQATEVAHAEQAPVERQAETPKENEYDLSEKFAALARKERAMLDRQKKLKEQQKAVEEFENLRKNARLNPKAVMDQLGISYEALTNFIINDEKPDQETLFSTKLEKLEKELEEERQARLETIEEQKKAQEQARLEKEQEIVGNYQSQLADLSQREDSPYEFVKAYGEEGLDLAFKIAEAKYEQDGKVIQADEAMKMAEEYLEGQVQERLLKSNKLKRMLGIGEEPTQTKPREESDSDNSFTLTNSLDRSATLSDSFDYIEDDEASKRRAAELLAKSLGK